MSPQFPVTEKVWGFEELICNEPEYCAKYLNIAPGGMSSLHYHKLKTETFVVLSGHCSIQTTSWSERRQLHPGDQVTIVPYQSHRFWVLPQDEPCKILEVSTHHYDDDSYRIRPSKRLTA